MSDCRVLDMFSNHPSRHLNGPFNFSQPSYYSSQHCAQQNGFQIRFQPHHLAQSATDCNNNNETEPCSNTANNSTNTDVQASDLTVNSPVNNATSQAWHTPSVYPVAAPYGSTVSRLQQPYDVEHWQQNSPLSAPSPCGHIPVSSPSSTTAFPYPSAFPRPASASSSIAEYGQPNGCLGDVSPTSHGDFLSSLADSSCLVSQGLFPGPLSVVTSSATRPQPVRSPFEWMRKQAAYANKVHSGKTRTKDKYRVVYTDHQRLELEKEFHYSRYITIRRKTELAQILGLTERQVKIWFQNRRAKERKQAKKRQDDILKIERGLDVSEHVISASNMVMSPKEMTL